MIDVTEHAKNIRRNVLRMIFTAQDGHLGCCLSAVDILVALYFGIMNMHPEWLDDPRRDRFLLSKGHAAAALYATLVERGIAPKEILDAYCRNGSVVASHVSRAAAPGIEVSTGSGGHALPIAIGMALAARNTKSGAHMYVLCGDGELAEGSMWEAIASAGHHTLGNLTLIVDANGFQSEGRTRDILDLDPLVQKFEAFHWRVTEVNGHNIPEMMGMIPVLDVRPHVVIAHTVKAKGIPFMEDNYIWHHTPPTQEQFDRAMEVLA